MSGHLTITGHGPVLDVAMLPDSAPFVVGMPDGGTLTCVLSAGAGAPVVAPPVLTAFDALAGRTLTITASATGTAPITLGIAITVNGAAVTPTLVSPGVWTYAAPSSTVPAVMAWTVTATNAVGSDDVSGGETIPADLAPPSPWIIDSPFILASPTVPVPTVSGSNITG